MTVRVDVIADPASPQEFERHELPHAPGWCAAQYLAHVIEIGPDVLVLYGDVAMGGGQLVALVPPPGARFTVCKVPQGGTAAVIVGIIVAVGLSFAIRALTPTQPRGPAEEKPIQNFDGFQTSRGPGVPIPFGYGRLRVSGHLMQSFERQVTGEQVTDGITTLFTEVGLCWGPIRSITDIRVNGVPVEDIEGVDVQTRLGEHDQAPMVGFDETVRVQPVSTPLRFDEPALIVVTTVDVQAIEVIFRFPQGLLKLGRSGKRRAHTVRFQVRTREFAAGANWSPPSEKFVTAETRNPFKSILRIDNLELGRYEVEIKRLTLDDEDLSGGTSRNITISEALSIQEITTEGYARPGIARMAFRQIPSAQLNQVPQDVQYTAIVEMADDVRSYTDEINYSEGWSDNPIECAAHWLTHPMRGLGQRYTWRNIHLPSYLKAVAYCNELVPDGAGGLEKRATFNHRFDVAQNGQQMREVFSRAAGVLIVPQGDTWRFIPDDIVDPEDDVIWVANEFNTQRGTFTYTYTDRSPLANRIAGDFLDEDDDYLRRPHTEEQLDLEQGDDVVPVQRDLFGITRKSHVARELVRYLNHNRLGDGVEVALEAGLSALRVSAGSVYGVSMVTAAIGIASGALRAVDPQGALLTIDEAITIESGKQYEVVITHIADDTIERQLLINPAGFGVTTLLVANIDWQRIPAPGDAYSVGELESVLQKFRCTSITLADGFQRRIEGIPYIPEVYTGDLAIEAPAVVPSLPNPDEAPPDVADLVLFERVEREEDGTLTQVVDVDWTSPVSSVLVGFDVFFREAAGGFENWRFAGTTGVDRTNFQLADLDGPGVSYEVAVVSVGVRRKKAPADSPSAIITTTGITAQPPDLGGFAARLIEGRLFMCVEGVTDPDFSDVRYRWKIGPAGSTYDTATELATTTATCFEVSSYPRGVVLLFVAAVSPVGTESAQPASLSLTLRGEVGENVVVTSDEFPAWAGDRTGFRIDDDGYLSLVKPAGAVAPRRRQRIPGRRRVFGFGAPSPTPSSFPRGTYTTPPVEVAAGDVTVARADVLVDFVPISLLLGTWADRSEPWQDMGLQWSGAEPGRVNIAIESRSSIVDEADLLTQPWLPHVDRGEITMKWFQSRIEVSVDSPEYSAVVQEITTSIDVPDKRQTGRIAVLSATAESHTYPAGYFAQVTALTVSVLGGAEGDTVRVTAEDKDGFTVSIVDSVGALTTGTVGFDAVGF